MIICYIHGPAFIGIEGVAFLAVRNW